MRPVTPGQGLLQLSGVIVDLVYRVDAVPLAGQEAVVRDFFIHPGGGFNAMQAARCAGIDVTYGGGIGSGPLGDLVAATLATSGIATARPRVMGADQGCSTVLIDQAAERTMIAREGAEGRLQLADLAGIATGEFDWWLVSGYQLHYRQSRQAMAAWLDGLSADVPLVFDPSPVVELIPRPMLDSMLAKAWWISANATEAASLSGGAAPREAAMCIMRGRERDDGGVIVRDGANGCFLATRADGLRHFPGHAVVATDSNGAGDTHIGSFIGACERLRDVHLALQYANIAAALSTTRPGPATAPGYDEVMAILDG